ncbi:hypothetical protein BDV12DRAFT_191402 [Aspergillus spectabilis]
MIHQVIVTLSRVLLAYELDRYSFDIGKIRVLLDASSHFELSCLIEHVWITHQNTGYGQTMTTKETFGFPIHERSNMKLPNPGSPEPLNP